MQAAAVRKDADEVFDFSALSPPPLKTGKVDILKEGVHCYGRRVRSSKHEPRDRPFTAIRFCIKYAGMVKFANPLQILVGALFARPLPPPSNTKVITLDVRNRKRQSLIEAEFSKVGVESMEMTLHQGLQLLEEQIREIRTPFDTSTLTNVVFIGNGRVLCLKKRESTGWEVWTQSQPREWSSLRRFVAFA